MRTPSGVRRAHSFDSYDNLDRWQASREHRKQFLSTRAKFDKVPPTQPPPPPPRHSSKSVLKYVLPPPLPTSSPVNSLIDDFKQKFKNEGIVDKENETFSSLSWEKNEEYSLYLPKDKPVTNNMRDTSISNHSKVNKSQNANPNEFEVLQSPGSVLKLTQSWQKYTEDPKEINIVNPSQQSVLQPEYGQENKKRAEEVNEPVLVKKSVDRLCYQEPTFFKDVNIPMVSRSLSDYHEPSVHHLDSFSTKKVQKAFIPSSEIQRPYLKDCRELNQSVFSNQRPNQLYIPNSYNRNAAKNQVNPNTPLHEQNYELNYSTQDDSKSYLESSLKMFAESLLEQEGNENADSSSIYLNNLPVGRPRRISTGSMHEPTMWRSQLTTEPTMWRSQLTTEPTMWRSQLTTEPVKALVRKFSRAENANDY